MSVQQATAWWCQWCGARHADSPGWPCRVCKDGPIVRIVIQEPTDGKRES